MKLNHTKLTLLIFSGLCVASFAFFVVAQENPSNDKNIFLDSDQDGLSDDEEKTYGTSPNDRDSDGDGYTDGVEVKSGYDPLKPAPGDKIVSNNQQLTTDNSQQDGDEENLTQELSVEVANLINEKVGENKEIALEDLDAVISEATGEEITFEDLPEVDEKAIKIKKQNYSKLSETERDKKEKEDALEYLTQMAYVLVNNSPEKISSPEDAKKFSQQLVSKVAFLSTSLSNVSYFDDLADKGEAALKQLSEIEVPENMLDLHKKGLQLANYAITLRSEARPDPEDPIATIMGLSKIQSLVGLTISFSEEISSRFAELGITEIPLEL